MLDLLVGQEPALQKELVDEWMVGLTAYFDRTAAVICAVGNSFTTNGDLMQLYGGKAQFLNRYPIIKEVKTYHEKKTGEMQGAFRRIKATEGKLLEDVLIPYSLSVLQTY